MISFDLLDEGFLNNVTQNGDLRGNWIVSPPAADFPLRNEIFSYFNVRARNILLLNQIFNKLQL